MFLLDWYREYLDIRQAHKVEKYCESCETLKAQLTVANHEKSVLMDRLLEKPEKVVERVQAPPMKVPISARSMPWAVRRQMLEQEDREKARALRNAPKSDATTPTADEIKEFEKEVDNAEATREAAKS